ncbi:MAG: hypothetical protein JWM57_767 [Phycisphaerales bacterium]|nr:hypothetical protein [Phycisphaerales bacterium]
MIEARPFDDTIANTPFDSAIEVLMAVMLLFLPLAFGGIEAWSREIWYALIAAMGLSLLLKQLAYRRAPLIWSWAYLPIALFLGLLIVQLVPLPRGLLQTLSPATVSTKSELLADVAGASNWYALTFNRFTTLQQAQMVLAVSTLFVVVLHVYRAPARLRRLLMTVMGVGFIVAWLAAYQDATAATLIYGIVPIGHKNAGPFLNYSQFSQFMNMSVGAAVGLLLMTVSEWLAADSDPRQIVDELKRPHHFFMWPALVLCVLGPIVVFWSMSRMGMISMLVAGAATAAMLGWRSGRQSGRHPGGLFLTICLGLAVLALLMLIGFDVVYDRLATLRHSEQSTAGRWQILKDLTELYAKFPLFGVGLGTHEFVFPMFSHQTGAGLFTHAENEYAQLLEECGGLGLLLALTFTGLVAAAYFRSVWKPRHPQQFAAFGLGFGLVAIHIHSFSDFGQHTPADASLTAIFSALLINIAASVRKARPIRSESAGIASLLMRGATAFLFCVGVGWILFAADRGRRAEAAFVAAEATAADLEKDGWRGDEATYIRLLGSATTAATLAPENVTYRHWLNVYRWQSISYDATDPATRRMEFRPEAMEFARKIAQEFDAIRLLCPTFGPPLCIAGQIRSTVLGEESGDQDIRTAFRLTPSDRTVCYTYGWLAVRHKDFDAAKVAFDRYLMLGGARWHVVDMYLLAVRPDLAFEVAKVDRWNLDRLAYGLQVGWPKEGDLVAKCRAESQGLLIRESEGAQAGPVQWMDRGRLEEQAGRNKEAAQWFQKAVEQDYGQVDWRLTLARALGAAGERDEAVRHLRICLRIRPKWDEVEKLLAAYSGRRTDTYPAAQ